MSYKGGNAIPPCYYSINNSVLKNSEMNTKEIWKDVVGYEGLYQVSNLGRVKSFDRVITFSDGRVRKFNGIVLSENTSDGYPTLGLTSLDKTVKTHRVHRLKGIAFIPNPENKPCINHRDGIKLNNGYNADGKDNLEWATYSENSNHAYENGLKVGSMTGKTGRLHIRSKPVIQLTMDGEYICEHSGQSEAARKLGLKNGRGISAVCLGTYEYSGGFKWKFKD